MKKISTSLKIIFLSIIFIISDLVHGQVLLNEDFSSGLLPTNWTQSSVSAGDAWEYGGSVDFGAASIIDDPFNNSGEYAHIDFSDDPDTTSLITPIVDISTLTTPRLTFYYISQTTSTSFSPYNRLIVDYWDGTSWINITVIDTLTTLGWTEYDFNISTYTFGTDSVQFRFSAQEGGAAIGGTGTATFDQDLALDDVTIEETPTCLKPTGVSASSITDSSLSLNWTENNAATQWEIEYATANFTQGTGNLLITSTNPDTILGLTSDTEYDFYVRSICAVGDTSEWSFVGTFKTAFACPAGAVCATYTTGDIDTDRAFTSLPGTSFCPGTLSVTIPAGNRIDSVRSRYTMTAIGSAWMSEQRSWLYSPNTNAGEASLSNGSANTTGTFSYDRSGLTFANGVTGVASFELHAGRTFGGSGCDANYSYVDNGTWIVIAYNSLAPSCLEPINSFATDITSDSVQLNWAGTGTATEWIVEWDTTGYTAGTSANSLVVLTDTFVVVTGLNELTTYDFYVRSICGPSDTSSYSTVESFTTPCDPLVAPFSEDFNALTIPSCWSQGAGNSEDWEFQLTDGHIGNVGNQGTGSTTSGGGLASVDDSSPHNTNTSLESPFIDVSALTTPRLNFFTISDNEGNINGNVDFHVDVFDGANWNDSLFFSDTNTLNGTWEQIFVDLSQLTITAPIKIRFVVDENNGTLFDDDRAIDDVVVEETPSCLSPTALLTSTTDSSAILSWTNGGTETEWQIEYDTTGFTQGTGTFKVTTTNPDTILGLQSATAYDFYVRAVCAIGDSSVFTSATNVATNISPAQGFNCSVGDSTLVFSDDLESLNGWTGDIGTGTSTGLWNYDANGTGSNNTGPSAAYSGTQYAYVETSGAGIGDSVSFISPAIDLTSANDFAELSFWLHSYGQQIGTLNVGVGTSVTGPFTEEFSFTGEVQSDELDPFENVGVNLDSYVGQTIYLEFLYITNGSFEGDIAIDLIEVSACVTPLPPAYAIGTINGEDSLGVADSLNVNCRISGTVTGVDRRGGGYEFALIDLSSGVQEGITVFDFSDLSNYTNPTEGDSLEIYGSVDQFNGLTQFRPDSIIILDSGNATVPTPNLVTNLDETTESKLVELNDKFVLLDPSGSFSYNMDATNGTDTITIRVDSDTDVNDSLNVAGNALIAGDTICTLIGIGGQFDNSSPYDDGYQVFPSRYSDITICRLAVCDEPTALSSTNISTDSAELSWTENGTAIEWEISYGSTGFTAGAGTEVIVSSNPFNLLNLTSNTAYDWYVRAICGVGDTSNWSDTSSFTTLAAPLPYYPIATITAEDSTGVADSLNVDCIISGTVTGIDRRGGGYEFALIDLSSGFQEGITVFDFNDLSYYTNPTEGDSLEIYGTVSQFNGLTQFRPDSIVILQTGTATIATPIQVADLDESTESKLLELSDDFVLLDPSGSFSFNMDATNGIDTITIRIDSESDIDDSLSVGTNALVPGDTICGMTGIGGQFDNSSPYTDGYQIFPSRYSDITICRLAVGLNDVAPAQSTFSIVPNPSSGEFSIRTSGFNNETVRIQIRDISGRMVMDEIVINAQNQMNKTIHLNENAKGLYFISIFDGDQVINQKLILK